MPTWLKYLLLQIPGCVIAGVILAGLWKLQWITGPVALLGFTLWVLSELLLYPFVKQAYENNAETGSAALVGARGVAQGELNPQGYIRVRGELWRAVAVSAHQKVSSGSQVEIVKAEGMQLLVRAMSEEQNPKGENS
jgi:membrane protein implicated in regulation of membrane protease activity